MKKKKRLPGEVAMTRSKPKEESLPDSETTGSGGQWKALQSVCRDSNKSLVLLDHLQDGGDSGL